MQAAMIRRTANVANDVTLMIRGVMVALAAIFVSVMVTNQVRIPRDGVDCVTVVIAMRMCRRGRNEAVACKCERQAKSNKAPNKRH